MKRGRKAGEFTLSKQIQKLESLAGKKGIVRARDIITSYTSTEIKLAFKYLNKDQNYLPTKVRQAMLLLEEEEARQFRVTYMKIQETLKCHKTSKLGRLPLEMANKMVYDRSYHGNNCEKYRQSNRVQNAAISAIRGKL